MPKKNTGWFLYYSLSVVTIQFACVNPSGKKIAEAPGKPPHVIYKKPGSNYPDTLQVTTAAAVFYQPDSLQLLTVKAGMDSSVYDGTMHEFFYQMRNARMVLKKTWPELKIIEVRNYRYLVFHKKDGSTELIDLDLKNDAYGMFIFNQIKSPLLIDMMNIETEVSFYLKE